MSPPAADVPDSAFVWHVESPVPQVLSLGMIPADQLFKTLALHKSFFFFSLFQDFKCFLKTNPLHAQCSRPPQAAPLAPALGLESSRDQRAENAHVSLPKPGSSTEICAELGLAGELVTVAVLFLVPSP